ncbi:MAG: L-serine ammonia-lyase, iron-sulfur-dependent, subunit alpha [Schwartzia succinivorans]|nr:L-serine ammonia-lyase, iron-sulfur-dependent, subunit alpha [Schwartzia succinivorans]
MYSSIADILEQSEKNKKEFWEVVMEADMESRDVSREASRQKMKRMLDVMKDADRSYEGNRKSASGLSGGDGKRLETYNQTGKNLCGPFLGKAMERAVKMGESNACMKRIVAAPTAGSCGVIPAVLLSYEEYCKPSEDDLINALYVAAGIGKVIGENASISGAFGGCQAEIGTASAMAAGALAYLQGGNNAAIANAAALALKNMLGLACDPVGGLVEVPCVKRNSHGAVNAAASAQLALAGIKSAISPDDVIDSMRRIGSEMPASLKETGTGGLATSESAKQLCDCIHRN